MLNSCVTFVFVAGNNLKPNPPDDSLTTVIAPLFVESLCGAGIGTCIGIGTSIGTSTGTSIGTGTGIAMYIDTRLMLFFGSDF